MCFIRLRRLVAGFLPLRPGFEPRSGHEMVNETALGQVFSDTSVSNANYNSTKCSTFIIVHHQGLVQLAKQRPRYQVHPVSPHPKKLKKKSVP
jgi:hypothetical protein